VFCFDFNKLRLFFFIDLWNLILCARYMDGGTLTLEDEKAVVEKLLAYHPHSEDKIGCGLESIMVSTYGISAYYILYKIVM